MGADEEDGYSDIQAQDIMTTTEILNQRIAARTHSYAHIHVFHAKNMFANHM